jgi:hypothetical protein
MQITAAGNTEVPAYLALIAKGYDVSHNVDGDFWLARKGNDSFSADGPLMLLGLVAMVENRGTNWRAADQEIDAFLFLRPRVSGPVRAGARARASWGIT